MGRPGRTRHRRPPASRLGPADRPRRGSAPGASWPRCHTSTSGSPDGVGTSGLDDLAPVRIARPTPRLREEVDFDLRGDLFDALAAELRLFGTRIVMIAGADADGQLAELVYTDRGHSDDELAVAFVHCLRQLDPSIADAVVYCDESVQPTVLAFEFGRIVERFEAARSFARDAFGVHLVDWVACERERFRSSHALADPGRDRWRRR